MAALANPVNMPITSQTMQQVPLPRNSTNGNGMDMPKQVAGLRRRGIRRLETGKTEKKGEKNLSSVVEVMYAAFFKLDNILE